MAVKIQKLTKWYNVYSELANLLIDFSNKNDKPGELLFKLCIEDYKFVDDNKWIDKFKKNFIAFYLSIYILIKNYSKK